MQKLVKAATTLLGMIALIAVFAMPAEARKSCAKKGYSVDYNNYGSVLLSRSVRDKKLWPETAARFYVCARKYGRRIDIGTYGLSWDGEIAFSEMTIDHRYAAFASGTSNNAGSVSDDGVTLIDMKTGKRRRFSVDNPSFEASVSAIALDGNGAIGWIVNPGSGPTGVNEVHLSKRSDGRAHTVVASGAEIDGEFLRFGYRADRSELIWATTTSGANSG